MQFFRGETPLLEAPRPKVLNEDIAIFENGFGDFSAAGIS
jgi:hypothetical protein